MWNVPSQLWVFRALGQHYGLISISVSLSGRRFSTLGRLQKGECLKFYSALRQTIIQGVTLLTNVPARSEDWIRAEREQTV